MIAGEQDARRWLQTLPGYDAACADKLDAFARLLVEENGRQNLIATSSIASMWRRHIVDSAQLLRHVPRETRSWLDLGTGAGFPGLIIALIAPSIEVTLIESRSRRAAWLTASISALRLTNAHVSHCDLRLFPTQAFEAISARAFAPLDRLISLAARFSTSDTFWLLPKGRSARDELAALSGWRHAFHVERSLTDPEAGIISGHLFGAEEQRE